MRRGAPQGRARRLVGRANGLVRRPLPLQRAPRRVGDRTRRVVPRPRRQHRGGARRIGAPSASRARGGEHRAGLRTRPGPREPSRRARARLDGRAAACARALRWTAGTAGRAARLQAGLQLPRAVERVPRGSRVPARGQGGARADLDRTGGVPLAGARHARGVRHERRDQHVPAHMEGRARVLRLQDDPPPRALGPHPRVVRARLHGRGMRGARRHALRAALLEQGAVREPPGLRDGARRRDPARGRARRAPGTAPRAALRPLRSPRRAHRLHGDGAHDRLPRGLGRAHAGRGLVEPGARPLETSVPALRYFDELPAHGIRVRLARASGGRAPRARG